MFRSYVSGSAFFAEVQFHYCLLQPSEKGQYIAGLEKLDRCISGKFAL
jgi:hypothetical protein